MSTQAEKFKEIADAIKTKTVLTNNNQSTVFTNENYKIFPNDFASQISSIDRLRPMALYPDGLDNGFYGNLAVRAAASYYYARRFNQDTFVYNSSQNLFRVRDRVAPVRDKSSDLTGADDVDGDGYGDKGSTTSTSGVTGDGRLDCSSYIGLALRGITYDKSPFYTHPKNDNEENYTWKPVEELEKMYGNVGWEFSCVDKQPKGIFTNIGFSGYSTLRFAADYGEFFYKYGHVLFDQKVDGKLDETSANSLMSKLKAGDLIFWAKDAATENQKMRFRHISHIGMVSEDTSMFFHVSNDSDKNVVLISEFMNKYTGITLVCRPDYRPSSSSNIIPKNINLLGYPWHFDRGNYTKDNITVKHVDMHALKVSGSSDAGTGIYLRGTSNYLTLGAGTYELSGMESATGFTKSANLGSLQIKTMSANDSSNPDWNDSTNITSCYSDVNPTITLTEKTKVYVRLLIRKGTTISGSITVTPTLKRT